MVLTVVSPVLCESYKSEDRVYHRQDSYWVPLLKELVKCDFQCQAQHYYQHQTLLPLRIANG